MRPELVVRAESAGVRPGAPGVSECFAAGDAGPLSKSTAVLAVTSRADALLHAREDVWAPDGGSVLSCSRRHFPRRPGPRCGKRRRLAGSPGRRPRSAAGFWSEVPERQCTTCFDLSTEIYSCVAGCLNYVCRGCSEDLECLTRANERRAICRIFAFRRL